MARLEARRAQEDSVEPRGNARLLVVPTAAARALAWDLAGVGLDASGKPGCSGTIPHDRRSHIPEFVAAQEPRTVRSR